MGRVMVSNHRTRSAARRCLESPAYLKGCRPVIPWLPFRRRCRVGLASAPEWAPLGRSRGGHDRPHGRPPRVASGAREVRSPGASAKRACGRARGRRGPPSGIIKSTSNDHLMWLIARFRSSSARNAPRRCSGWAFAILESDVGVRVGHGRRSGDARAPMDGKSFNDRRSGRREFGVAIAPDLREDAG